MPDHFSPSPENCILNAPAPLLVEVARAAAFRRFLDRPYQPAPGLLAPPEDATLVCRCEEVTAGQVRAAARMGATRPNQAKACLRCGMGPCQGQPARHQPGGGRHLSPALPYKSLTMRELADG